MSIFDDIKDFIKKEEDKNKQPITTDLGYGALYDAIDKLIKQKHELEDENKYLREKNRKIKEPTILEKKINDFIDWFKENMLSDLKSYKTIEIEADRLRKYIEKVAVWYELRYPDYEINRIFPGGYQEDKRIDKIMFQDNPYIESIFDEDSDVRLLDWDSFYNTSVFVKSLTSGEIPYIAKPKYYRDILYYDNNHSPHFHISSNGTVLEGEFMEYFKKEEEGITNKNLEGKNIKEVIEIFKEAGIPIPNDSEILQEVRRYDNRVYFKCELLDCIMYEIINRGGSRFGPRRAFLFAKEFNRDISIPMKYGVIPSSPGQRYFINEYLKAGGDINLECLVDYHIGRKTSEEDCPKATIRELLKTEYATSDEKYTEEEKEIWQRLVDDINMTIDHDTLQKERVKQLRLERKLNRRNTKD